MKIAKKLKKNNVAVDIVSFGHEAENGAKLEAFYNTVNANGNGHLVTVPPGPVLSGKKNLRSVRLNCLCTSAAFHVLQHVNANGNGHLVTVPLWPVLSGKEAYRYMSYREILIKICRSLRCRCFCCI